MDTINTGIPTVAGTPFAGGFYAGRILVGDDIFALIVAPKAQGEREDVPLLARAKSVPGTESFFDGHTNSMALAAADSELAQWAGALTIGGLVDWYLPSRDELEILYRAFKPTDEENYCWRGDNPSSLPRGYAYSRTVPAQTAVEAFRENGAEAFAEDYYWSSTQYAGGEAYAWCQTFDDGTQDGNHEDGTLRARAVRRLKI